MQLVIGQNAFFSILTDPADGYLITPIILYMAFQTIVSNIKFGIGEPAGKGMLPYLDLIPGFKPEKMRGNPTPECIRI